MVGEGFGASRSWPRRRSSCWPRLRSPPQAAAEAGHRRPGRRDPAGLRLRRRDPRAALRRLHLRQRHRRPARHHRVRHHAAEATRHGLKVPVIMDASPYYSTSAAATSPSARPTSTATACSTSGRCSTTTTSCRAATRSSCSTWSAPTTPPAARRPTRPDNLSAKPAIDWLNGRATARNAAGQVVGRLAQRQDRHDRQVLRRHARHGDRGDRREGPDHDRADQRRSELLRLHPQQRRGHPWQQLRGLAGQHRHQPGPPGLLRAGPRRDGTTDGDETGDYTAFWNERSYVKKVRQGQRERLRVPRAQRRQRPPGPLQQVVVRPGREQRAAQAVALPEGHVDPFDSRRAVWVVTLHRWFDFWLQGVQTGSWTSRGSTSSAPPTSWETARRLAGPGTRGHRVFLQPRDDRRVAVSERGPPQAGAGAFQDNPTQSQNTMIASTRTWCSRTGWPSCPRRSPRRCTSPARRRAAAASADQTDTNLGAILVDYGTAERVSAPAPPARGSSP